MAKRPKTTKKTAQSPKKKPIRHSLRSRGRHSASIYFLLWTIFSAFALVVVLFLGFSQQALLRRTYKDEAMREVSSKGEQIHAAILQGPPEAFGNSNYDYLNAGA